jgi:hypothetical protein
MQTQEGQPEMMAPGNEPVEMQHEMMATGNEPVEMQHEMTAAGHEPENEMQHEMTGTGHEPENEMQHEMTATGDEPENEMQHEMTGTGDEPENERQHDVTATGDEHDNGMLPTVMADSPTFCQLQMQLEKLQQRFDGMVAAKPAQVKTALFGQPRFRQLGAYAPAVPYMANLRRFQAFENLIAAAEMAKKRKAQEPESVPDPEVPAEPAAKKPKMVDAACQTGFYEAQTTP